jgi:hypothetical protein
MSTKVEAGIKAVRTELVGIQCISVGSDGGDYLQIYGSLGGLGVVAAGFWDRDSSNSVNISQGQFYPIGTVKVLPVQPGGELRLYGRLWEKDPVSDDFMGENEAKIRYDQISTAQTKVLIPFQESGQKVQAVFTLKENT